jgi:hypothetical protein
MPVTSTGTCHKNFYICGTLQEGHILFDLKIVTVPYWYRYLTVSVADPGCLSRIPDPTFFRSGSRIRTVSIPDPGSASKNLGILTQKKPKHWFLSSRKYDPGCSSRIPDPDADLLPSRIPDPGVKKALDPGSWIRIRNIAYCTGTVFSLYVTVPYSMNFIHSFSLPAGYSEYSHHQPAAEGPPACPCTGPTAGQDRRRSQPR